VYVQIGTVLLDPYNKSSTNFWIGITILVIAGITLMSSPFVDRPLPMAYTPAAEEGE
jgi:hypothetical protein